MRRCPYCQSGIDVRATRCRYCHADLPTSDTAAAIERAEFSKRWWMAAIAVGLIGLLFLLTDDGIGWLSRAIG